MYGVTQSQTRLKRLSSSSSSRDFPGGPVARTANFPLDLVPGLGTKISMVGGGGGGECVCARTLSVTQSCLTLFDPLDYSPSDSSVHGIFRARILEWVAISSSRASSQLRNPTSISCISCLHFGQILYR